MAKRVGLKVLRAKHELTQEEMAKKCGLAKSTYCLIEQGNRKGTLAFWNKVQQEFGLTGEEVWDLQNGK